MATLGKVVLGAYFVGYWFYLISAMVLAWPNLTLWTYGSYALTQAMVAILWPAWLIIGRPLTA
jgi:hypothetical protein